ncbi:MAG: glutathione synthase, partial [Nitrosomonadales bacterium]
MHFLFILDPLDSLKPHKDTSLAIMHEAARRGHQLSMAEQGGLMLRDGLVGIQARDFEFAADSWHTGDATLVAPEIFDAVLMRKDPPFDMEYIYSTYLLELAEQQGARVFNRPRSIRDFNEKLSVAQFAEFAPPFLVTRQMALIREFLDEYGD